MSQMIIVILLWISLLGSALIAGLFFAFSTFVMQALAQVPNAQGIVAMQLINRVIQRSLFMPVFFISPLASLVLAVLALFWWDRPGSATMLIAGILYVLGMFVCTMRFNVPLNNALDQVQAGTLEAEAVWNRYLREWVVWNHVRTVASLAACALYAVSLDLV